MASRFDPGARLIAAIDVPNARAADDLILSIGDATDWFKLGLELFAAEGPGLVKEWVGRERRVMLDLKLHDIPKTIERCALRIADLGTELLTVHAAGGTDMLEAAVQGAGATKILAVTVLTSLDQEDLRRDGNECSAEALVLRRAELAAEAGVFGVVASPLEAQAIRGRFGDALVIVTPGVRPLGSRAGDQSRVATPSEARRLGADLVVVGRPIREAASPYDAACAIARELSHD